MKRRRINAWLNGFMPRVAIAHGSTLPYYTENLYKQDYNMTTIYEIKECEVEATLLAEEFRKILKVLTNGKSPGSDGIPLELLKGSRRRSSKGVNTNMPTNLDKKDLAKTMEGLSICASTKKEMPESILQK